MKTNLFRADPLGDGISSVEVIHCMGTDLTVVNAARVSMAKQSSWDVQWDNEKGWRKTLSERDKRLINYLARHNHWTPFSHPQITLRLKMPIFVARQWFKHQVGFTRNEVSRRYVDDPPEFYLPKEWRKRAENVKQGSSDEIVANNEQVCRDISNLYAECSHMYQHLLSCGVCPEQARMVLPQSTYTEFYETGSLAGYARLVRLRKDSHAQKEIRQYAAAISSFMEMLFPVSWEALTRTEVSTNE